MLFIAPVASRHFCMAIIFWQGDIFYTSSFADPVFPSFMLLLYVGSKILFISQPHWLTSYLERKCILKTYAKDKGSCFQSRSLSQSCQSVCSVMFYSSSTVCVCEYECVQNPKRPLRAVLGKERLCMDWYPCGDRNGSLGNVVISWLHMWCLYQGCEPQWYLELMGQVILLHRSPDGNRICINHLI